MSKTIIQIEHDATVGQLVSSILTPKGYEIELQSSGQKALELLKQKTFDIAIVGDQLDDLDGIGFIVQFRKHFAKQKLVFVTKTWPPSELYERLTKDLKVDLVAIRPLKASIFGVQIDSLLGEAKPKGASTLSPEQLHFEAMQALRSKYIIVLPERIKKLTEAFDAAREQRQQPRYLEDAIRLAHNLKGTSGSCGLIELSEASAHLESALKAILASGLVENETSWDEIQNFLDYVVQVANVVASSSEVLETSTKLKDLAEQQKFDLVDDPELAGSTVYSADAGSAKQMQINANRLPASTTQLAESSNSTAGEVEASRVPKHLAPVVVSPQTVTMDTGLLAGSSIASRLLPVSDDATSVRVLIVSSEALPAIERRVDGLPVQLIGTSSQEEAVIMAKALALDAALIDISMESPSPGITLARTLRTLPGNESLPVAFVSTSSQPSSAETAHAGASLFLEKPIKQQMLANAVDYLLSVRSGGRPRILIIDDDEDFVKVIGSILGKEGMIVKAVLIPENVPETVAQFAPDVVLLDVMMPGISGYQICQQIRERSQFQDLPILFLTAQTGLSARLAAFEAGGDDYLPKPVAPAELLMRVKVRLERARLLRERADKDVLTGLMIRRAFMEQLSGLLSESKTNNLRFSLCLLDIDHFKHVNDNYGHLSGDRVLAYFGQLIRRRFRVEDLRGRWGGEEFIVAFRHIDKQTAKGALERCLDELKGQIFEGDNGEIFSVSFSGGLVSFPEDGESPQTLIKLADECLYEAKHRGRSQVVARGG